MDNIIHLSIHLKCNPNEAFGYFTKNEKLEDWLTAKAEVKPVVGGKYELFWEPSDRENNSTIGCHLTTVESNQLLSFEWRSPKQFKHFANQANPLTHVVVCFIPVNSGTTVHLIHSGWRSSQEWEDAMQWQGRAWQMAFQELEKLVNIKST